MRNNVSMFMTVYFAPIVMCLCLLPIDDSVLNVNAVYALRTAAIKVK